MTPVEIEFHADGSGCSPGNEWFDYGLRSAVREPTHRVSGGGGGERLVTNPFRFASEQPWLPPLRVRISPRFDGSIVCGVNAAHYAVRTAAPFRCIRLAPARPRGTSFWAAPEVTNSCERMGRVMGTLALEALYRETGVLNDGECLALGQGISRDPKFSQEPAGLMFEMRESIGPDLPTIVMWTVAFGVALVSVLVG